MAQPLEFPARLHVLLAREAPVGLVIRRGPAKQVCTLLWDRRTDTFQIGQWFKGRIYAQRCDLSPDGKHWIYFAMSGAPTGETQGSWTAVSRTPYLKALGLFAKGDCWHGGGLFTENGRYWLNDGHGHTVVRDSRDVVRDHAYSPASLFGGECPGVYFVRLVREGWRLLVARERIGHWHDQSLFEKPVSGGWALRKIAHAQVNAPPGKGCYWDEHVLARPGMEIGCPDWEWAELDGERLVWASGGKLFAGGLGANGLVDVKTLHDFNGMVFERIHAPY
ncbi:hypothetical protein ACYOEI_18305 [Singulisphaera rosea]